MACRCASPVAIMLGRIRIFHPTMTLTDMSDPKPQKQDAETNWKALQAELGLISEEPKPASPAPKPSTSESTASMWGTESGEAPLPVESPFLEGAIPAGADADDRADVPVLELAESEPGSEHDVEVGEAPEEIPME